MGTLRIWAEPFVQLRVPKLFNLRTDPYRAGRHHLEHLLRLDVRPHLSVRSRLRLTSRKMLETLVEFPQRQKSASFSLDQVMAKLQDATTGSS